jgi:hypothetical protein
VVLRAGRVIREFEGDREAAPLGVLPGLAQLGRGPRWRRFIAEVRSRLNKHGRSVHGRTTVGILPTVAYREQVYADRRSLNDKTGALEL